jgi:hypothetical protein
MLNSSKTDSKGRAFDFSAHPHTMDVVEEVPTLPTPGPSVPSTSTTLCQQCSSKPSKYKCPRCALPTCSLACSKAHKASTGCSGERDKTKKVALKDYGYGAMMDDYVWLEEGRRRVEGWGKEIIEKGLDKTGIVDDARAAMGIRFGGDRGRGQGQDRGRGRGRGRGQSVQHPYRETGRGRGRGRDGNVSTGGRRGAPSHRDDGGRGGRSEGREDRGRGTRTRGAHSGDGHRPSVVHDSVNVEAPASVQHDSSVHRDQAQDRNLIETALPTPVPNTIVAQNTVPKPIPTPIPAAPQVFDQTIPRPSKLTHISAPAPAQLARGLALAYGSGSDSE